MVIDETLLLVCSESYQGVQCWDGDSWWVRVPLGCLAREGIGVPCSDAQERQHRVLSIPACVWFSAARGHGQHSMSLCHTSLSSQGQACLAAELVGNTQLSLKSAAVHMGCTSPSASATAGLHGVLKTEFLLAD